MNEEQIIKLLNKSKDLALQAKDLFIYFIDSVEHHAEKTIDFINELDEAIEKLSEDKPKP